MAKGVLVLALNVLEVLKNCDLKTKKVIRPFLNLKELLDPNFG